MKHLKHTVWLAWALFCAADAWAAEKPTVARVGRAPGLLAVRSEPGGAWRLLARGDALPKDCRLRTAGAGPCLVELPGGTLHLSPDTRLKLEAHNRRAVLESGRTFLQVGRASALTTMADGLKVVLQEDSAAELTVEPDKTISVHVTRGSAVVTRGGDEPTRAAAGTTVAFDPAAEALRSASLKPPQQKRIEAWTALKGPSQGLGQLLIKDVQSGAPTRLNVARYHVHVVLHPPVALVHVDQSFYNPYSRQEEGTFVFNLPRGASVSRFAMYVTPERLIEGELIERSRASEIYESIVRRRRDPAILEQIGDNLFRMRVFPIFAKDTKRILLDYTLPLEDEGGSCRFRLPLFSDLEPIWDFRLTGTIHGPARLESVASQSHPSMALKPQGDGQIAFELIKRNYRPETDFLLGFAQKTDGQATLRSHLAGPLPGQPDTDQLSTDDPFGDPPSTTYFDDPFGDPPSTTYFMASVRPPPLEGTRQQPKPADVLILADTSSGMLNCAALSRSVRTIVRNLPPGDRLRLVCVDVGARPVHQRWLEPGTESAEQALARFRRQFCLGGTDLETAFREALKVFDVPESKRRRLVLYIGDGEDTLSRFSAERLPGLLARHLQKAKATLFGVIVRKPASKLGPGKPRSPAVRRIDGQQLLRSLARATGGLVFDLPGNPHGERDLFDWLLASVPSPEKILKVEVEGAAEEDLYYPTAWLPGQKLNVLGRTRTTDRLQMRLTTTRGGKPTTVRRDLTVDPTRDDVFVGRLWAQRRLDRLVRRHEVDPDGSDEARREIVRLSREWSLLSPYTAFLVLETEEDYARWQIDRRQRRRYWKPPGALPQAPLPVDWLTRVTPDPEDKTDPQRFTRAVRSARKALAEGNHSLAFRLLQRVGKLRMAAESREYAKLSRHALAGVRDESLREQLGAHHSLLDPAVRGARPRFRASLSPLLGASTPIGPEFLRRHPHATQLLRDVDFFMPSMTVKEMAELLANQTEANVVIDYKALDDVGLGVDRPISGLGWVKLSLRNYARFVLGQLDLVMLEEPNRLLITTPEEAGTRLSTRIYPVADLLLTERVADWGLLMDPYMDRELAAKRRIRAKLKRPISVSFQDTPLTDVIRHFAGKLNDTVLIDEEALSDVGIDPDNVPVTAAYHDVPAEQALHWILDQLDLDYVVQHEALLVLTAEERENRLETRLHSGRGVVYEYSVPALQQAFQPRGGWGGMGGFGGMGFGGLGMGGMGMGLRGMGGGMGSFGGASGDPRGSQSPFVISVIPVVGPEESPPDVDLSEGGDPSLPPPENRPRVIDLTPEPEDPTEALETNLSLTVSQTQGVREDFAYDVDSVVEQVTATVAPTSWDTVGGPGSLAFFEPTLDFVIGTTDEIHDQIESLFGRLRQLPAVAGPRTGIRSARVRPVGPDDVLRIDTDSLIDAITSNVAPVSWDEVGGPGSIAVDLPRLALLVSQTADVHDELSRLLTMLRRSRYASLRSDQPWESTSAAAGSPLLGPLAALDSSTELRLSKLPQPKPAELAALAARRVPAAGRWKWRRVVPDGGAQDTIVLRRWGRRMEIELPRCTLRTEGDAAAVAYADLALVEHGHWAEATRQMVDTWLPWLPHRTNEELARWFDVRVIGRKNQNRRQRDVVRLRLVPPGFSPQGDTYLEAVFSTTDGLPRIWESYLHGKLTGRLRFAAQVAKVAGGRPGGRNVVLEDAAGKPLVRWEPVESQHETEEIPELTGGFPGYVHLDRRSDRPGIDPAFHRALAAMRQGDWPAAVRQLDAAERARPRQPLLLLLRAWCHQQDQRAGRRDRIVAALRQVAAAEATALTRFIAEGSFPWLSARQRYEILSLAPPTTRTAVDWDHLVRAAVAAGELEAALDHARAALAMETRDGREFERERIRVEILLRLDRGEQAAEAAGRWAAAGAATTEQLATMAELLAAHGRDGTADALFARALAPADLSAQQRHGLMCRRADVQDGLARWRTLLQAAVLVPTDSPGRRRCMAVLLRELSRPIHAEIASALAGRTKDPHLQGQLLIRQAELILDPATAGDVLWHVHQSGQLSGTRLCWACDTWNRARQGDRVILASEQRLVSGKELPDRVDLELEDAYLAAGRTRDARRAATSDPKPSPSPTPRPPDSFSSTPGGGMW